MCLCLPTISFFNPRLIDVPEGNPSSAHVPSIITRICTSARGAFCELGIALGSYMALTHFFIAPLTVTLMSGMLISTLVTAVIHTAFTLCRYREKEEVFKALDANASEIQSTSRASVVNMVGLAGPNILIHEAGHAISASLLFKNAQPSITVVPFYGGMTTYTTSFGLRKAGQLLGWQNAALVVCAAGMMASTLFAMIEFAGASFLQERFPTISEVMRTHAFFQLLNEVVYAVSAFVVRQAESAHDYVYLWQEGGVNPLIPIAFMIVLPLLETALLRSRKNRNTASKTHLMSPSLEG